MSDEARSTRTRIVAETVCLSIGSALFAAGIFIYFSWQPLWHTDLWGHLAYGRWMTEHGHLPRTDPFLPWNNGERFIDTAWLSQWIGYRVYRAGGVGGIQWIYAGTIALAATLLARSIARRTRSLLWGLVGAAIFLAIDWEQLKIVRPQIAGLLCYVLLLAIVLEPPRSFDGARIAALFVLWANLHGSFVIGWISLAALWAEQMIRSSLGIGHRSIHQRLRRHLAKLLGVAIVATLVNPYGPLLYGEVGRVALNTNVRDLIEWKPLVAMPRQFTVFVIAIIASFLVLFRTRVHRSRNESLLWFILAVLTMLTSRMIVWWGPVAGWMIAYQASFRWSCRGRFRCDGRRVGVPRMRSLAMGMAILGAAILVTPAGLSWLGIRPLEFEQAVSTQTPTAATEYLLAHPPRGVIFNPLEWGDYLVWAGPHRLQVFANSHVHLIPRPIWQDYLNVHGGNEEALAMLARHDVEVVVADPNRQGRLISMLRAVDSWHMTFEDDRAMIFARRRATERERTSPN